MKPTTLSNLWLLSALLLCASCNKATTPTKPSVGTPPTVAAKPSTTLSPSVTDEVMEEYPLNMGNNPTIITKYTADPTARVFDDKLYLYPSTDIPDPADFVFNGFCMPNYNVYVTENYMDWKDFGEILHQTDIPWARQDKYCMWAPDCNKRGDTYYFYFPTHTTTGQFGVGVATSKNPGGPFEVMPTPIKGVNGIDPNTFIDDDGQGYIYWGGGNGNSIKGSKLKENMMELEGSTIAFEGLPQEYKEASFMFKRNGIYYLTFSHSIGNCELSYATGNSPLGPFTYKGQIMDMWKNCWTNHHSMVEYKGEWILFYHHNDISGEDKKRSVCADYLTFAENGDINPVVPTRRGIGTIHANREIQVDRYSEADESKLKTERLTAAHTFPTNWALTQIQSGATVRYNRVDFAPLKATKLQIRYNATASSNSLTVATAEGDKTIATTKLDTTSGEWITVELPITYAPKGVEDLVLTFKGATPMGIDWIKFL